MSLVYAMMSAIVAQLLIYSGLLFMAGKLLPAALAPVYHVVPGSNYRLFLATMTVMLIGNLFFQRLYYLQPVLTAGIISTVCGICIVTVGGLMVDHKAPSLLLSVGVVVLLIGAVICVYARDHL